MTIKNRVYDVAIIGAGAAGCMAAIRAGQSKQMVILIERNKIIGRKILITSNGRCNLTNTALLEVFLKKFSPNPEFYRTAFFKFFSNDLKEFFKAKGLRLKVENRGRILPITNKAKSVNVVLENYLKENNVTMVFSKRVVSVASHSDYFSLSCKNNYYFKAKKVIIATGGVTYQATGSTGDGFVMARQLGHKITNLSPGLVPLVVEESFIKELQGLSFDNVQITVKCDNRKTVSSVGEMIFTHFGLSGPLVLDASGDILPMLIKFKKVKITLDFCPDYKKEELESAFIKKMNTCGKAKIKSLLGNLLPKRMVEVFLSLLMVQTGKTISQTSKQERLDIITNLKNFPLTIIGSLSFDEAMVTCGGVSIKEINPRTMESNILPGVYFAGEIIESTGKSGGYNLQQAFSTGYLAGSIHCKDKTRGS